MSDRFTRILRAIISLIVGVIVLNLIRIGTDLLSTRLILTSEQSSLLYLIPMTAILVFNGFVVWRLGDRLLSLVYAPMITVVVVTELGSIYAFRPGNSALAGSLIDGGVMLLVGVIFYRATMLLMETYQQRHERLLEDLA